MKKVLVLYYSQTGQLRRVLESFTSKLADEEVSVEYRAIKPQKEYAFPWSFYDFFDEFPEAVQMSGCEIEPLQNIDDDYDLIILGYTVWYMAPSVPMTAFMQSTQAKRLFKDKPIVTVVACRDMWVLAQEKVKNMLESSGARLIDHVALTDQGGSVKSLVSLPMWMLSGDKQYFSSFPKAGISEEAIANCERFGSRLNEKLKANAQLESKAMLTELGACEVNGKLIATEKIADRSFKVWTKLIKASGAKHSFGRKISITIYVAFLLALIFTVIPLNILVRKILNKFQREKILAMEAEYELPSGR